MSISGQQPINIGLPNESINSDSLYTAFTKTQLNFDTLFTCASPFTNFVGGEGITTASNANTGTVTITNTGVTNIIAGTNIVVSQANGNVTISATGGGNGNGGGTVTSVGLQPISNARLVVTNSPIVSSGNINIDLAATGIIAGSYTYPNVTVDVYGRVTGIQNGPTPGTVTSVGLTAGPGVVVSGGPITAAGNIVVTNSGVIKLTAGNGIDLSGSNGNVTISLAGGGVGTVTSVGLYSTSLDIAGGPITTAGTITVNIPTNPTVTGNLTTGNANLGTLARALYFSGDGSNLANIKAANVVGTVGSATTAATVTTAAQPNITSVGTLNSLAVVGAANPSLGNNVTANFFTGSGQNLNSLSAANIIGTVSAASNATRVSTTLVATGTYFLPFISATASANYSLNSNAAFSANLANGGLIATTFAGNLTGNVTGNVIGNVTGNLTGNVTGNISGTITAPGTNTQVIFNDAGSVNATSGLTFNKSTNLLTVTGNVVGGNLTTAGAVAATGNVSGGNLTTTGLLSVTGNANIGNLGTAAVVATGNISGGNLTTLNSVSAGTVIASGNITGANLVATSYYIRSISTGIAANGTTQGTAAALTKEINVVSTVSADAGVILPSAVAGMVIIINNTSANTLNVYPASGATINSLAMNSAYSHVTGASLQYYATSSTQWYTVGASYA